MATKLQFDKIWKGYDEKESIIFRTSDDRRTLWVTSFENGIATVEPGASYNIYEFAEMVVACFEKELDFEGELNTVFGCNPKTAFKGIEFTFNDATVMVSKKNADKDKIVEAWRAGMDAYAEWQHLNSELAKKHIYDRDERAKALKKLVRRRAVEKEVLTVDETTELEFKDDEAKAKWEAWFAMNSKYDCSLSIATFVLHWVKYMQHLMNKHNKALPQIAKEACYASNLENTTWSSTNVYFIYGDTVGMISQCWKYGEELRRWHNKNWGQENFDGVVNPGNMLTIDVG